MRHYHFYFLLFFVSILLACSDDNEKEVISLEQSISINDIHFKAWLLTSYDTDNNGEISYQEASKITNIELNTYDITSVKGIECMPNLTILKLEGMKDGKGIGTLTDLDISNNSKLEALYCAGNQLNQLDISANKLLTNIDCSFNKLTSIQVDKNTLVEPQSVTSQSKDTQTVYSLKRLFCHHNNIIELIPSAFPSLQHLNAQYNELKDLDISTNHQLSSLKVFGNQELSTIKVGKDFDKSKFTTFEIPAETAILYVGGNSTAVTIEDAYFRSILTAKYDLNKDGKLTTDELEKITELVVFTDSIYSLQGIEYMINLQILSANARDESYWRSKLTYIDLSKNRALKTVDLSNNQLVSLDFSKNTQLQTLICRRNKTLTSLNVDGCKELQTIVCSENHLKKLDVSGLEKLTYLDCQDNSDNLPVGDNGFTTLVVDNCSALKTLKVNYNKLAELDLTGCSNLGYLDCSSNYITALNLEPCNKLYYLNCKYNNLPAIYLGNTPILDTLNCCHNELNNIDLSYSNNLRWLNCSENKITNLDITHYNVLTHLDCSRNELRKLNVSKNTALTDLNVYGNQITTSFDISNNTNLKRFDARYNWLWIPGEMQGTGIEYRLDTIFVWIGFDENTDGESFLIDKDKNTHISRYVEYGPDDGKINIPDMEFKKYLLQHYDINHSGEIAPFECKYVSQIVFEGLDINNQKYHKVKSLAGIENFPNLWSLDISYGPVTEVNISKNMKITHFSSEQTDITELDFTNHTKLFVLKISECSNLKTIKLGGCIGLHTTWIYNNPSIERLNLRDCISLYEASIFGNDNLIELDLGGANKPKFTSWNFYNKNLMEVKIFPGFRDIDYVGPDAPLGGNLAPGAKFVPSGL